jgi:hypothetical protein
MFFWIVLYLIGDILRVKRTLFGNFMSASESTIFFLCVLFNQLCDSFIFLKS